MLTKNDLNQISNLMDKKFDINLAPIKKDIKQIKKTQDTMLDMLDKEQMEQGKRITRLEEHASLPTPQ